MKVVILAGGLGTRISEESLLRPKPLIEIGSKPIIWHIMKHYSKFGLNDFIICCGYKGYMIKEYFYNYSLHTSDATIDIKKNNLKFHNNKVEPWKITLIDTGIKTLTGGRIKRVKNFLSENFCLTYGDGLSNVDIKKTINFHKKHKKYVTVTAVQPKGRFGVMSFNKDNVTKFSEKLKGDQGWVNGGFFVLNKKILNFIKDDNTIWEQNSLPKLALEGQVQSYKHSGFWHPMDTLRDKEYLEELWNKKDCPWKSWDE